MEEPFVPQWFRSQLASESNNRLRIRFSHKRGLWQIEAKKYRAKNLNRRLSPFDDEGIRERDGYDLVLEIAPGTRVQCPNDLKIKGQVVRCNAPIRVPDQRWRETACPVCKARLTAPFFPLGSAVLEHLRYIDPDRDGLIRVFRDVDEGEALRIARNDRHRHNVAEAIFKEERKRVLEIPMVGYSGKGR